MDATRTARRSGSLKALGFGLLGTTAILGVFLAVDADVTITALALLVPVAVASARGGSAVAVAVAVTSYAAVRYVLWFVPPIGHLHIHTARDAAILLTFFAVGIILAVLLSRRSGASDPAVIDDERAALLRTVSHDLRAPLHTIQAVTTGLLQSGRFDTRTRRTTRCGR